MHRKNVLAAAAAAVVAVLGVRAQAAQQIGDVFVISMENHNWTQPNPTTPAPQQILNNPAAPYINSLVTPGNANATYSSYATNYYNAGIGVHPSEPNYVWAEAGTDFGVHTDADPAAANNNIFTAPHLTSLMNNAGVSWKNYQEDVQFSTSPTKSANGTSTTVTNPYYGTGQYNYAVKHNPMAFFSDTQTQNTYQLSQLAADLNNNTVGRYNWITPNQYNDQHSSLNTDFNYAGTTWTHNTDQQAIAIGDHFLSQIIPQIEASQAFQNNGAIVIWWDETENGDTTANTIGEIVISKLGKGNAYATSVELNHSSDIKTMQEIFGLGPSYLNNAIPATETNASGVGYNNVSAVNDLSSMFQPGVIPTAVPEPASLGMLGLGALALIRSRRSGR